MRRRHGLDGIRLRRFRRGRRYRFDFGFCFCFRYRFRHHGFDWSITFFRQRIVCRDCGNGFNRLRLYLGGGNARVLTADVVSELGDDVVIVPNTAGIVGGVRAWDLRTR